MIKIIDNVIISIKENKKRKELKQTLINRYGRKKGIMIYNNIIRYHLSNKKVIEHVE